MYSELRVEDRAELIKAAFLDELQTILVDRSQMTKGAQPIEQIRAALRSAEALHGAAGPTAAGLRAAEARAVEEAVRSARGVPRPAPPGPPGMAAPGVPAAAAAEVPTAVSAAEAPAAAAAARPAAPRMVDTPRGPVPEDAIRPVRGVEPEAAAVKSVPRGEQVADQLGLMERWRLQGMRPSNWRHLLAPAAAGIGTTMLTGSPGLGIAAGLGTYGLGRLGRVGRGPTAVQQAAEEGEQAWRADMSAGKAVGTRAEYVERAHQKMQDVMRRNPLMAEEYYRAAAPSYLRGAAIAVPSALGLGYWGGKKMLEGITNTGEGDSGQGNFLQNLALSAGGVYGGKQIADWATQQGYLPSWAQWPVALAAGAIAPRVAGG